MSKFAIYQEQYSNLDGWFKPEAQAIWDCLLSFQFEKNTQGNMLEIGVWEGKSATLSTLYARKDEQCLFVDPILSDSTMERLRAIHDPGCIFFKCISDNVNNPKFFMDRNSRFRWIHIDGEHTGMAVKNDLEIADKLLHRWGIVCIDDFLAPAYPQITLAVFRYIDSNPGAFTLALCGFNKGYLCRPIFASSFRMFIYKELGNELKKRDAGEFTLWRTTVADDLNTFGISARYQDKEYRGPDWAPEQIII